MSTTDSSQLCAADIYLLLCANIAPHNRSKITNVLRKKIVNRLIGRPVVVDAIENVGDQLSSLFNR